MKTLYLLILAAAIAGCASSPGAPRATGEWKPVNPPTLKQG